MISPIAPDEFEETESRRIADLNANNLEVQEVAGEIVLKIEKGTNLREINGKEKIILKFKLTQYNPSTIHLPSATVQSVFKDDKKEYNKMTEQDQITGKFKNSKVRLNIPTGNMHLYQDGIICMVFKTALDDE